MYNLERRLREKRQERQTSPSFSSTLLDEIYRSIDNNDNDDNSNKKIKGSIEKEELKFYRETMGKKQQIAGVGSKNNNNRACVQENEEMMKIQRARLIEKYMEKKKLSEQKQQQQQQRKQSKKVAMYHHDDHQEQDAMFFSSGSSSFDSSSGGFSSSDTESLHGSKPSSTTAAATMSSCFVPTRPKPVRTTSRSDKTQKAEKTERNTMLYDNDFHRHHHRHYHYNLASDQTPKLEDGVIKSKSRALKIYSNLKKMKQPISPGGRLTSFINSLFTAGHTKKGKNSSSGRGNDDVVMPERKQNSGYVSTCSSASSFSRSCLSKNSPSTREKLRNADKRTVRFCDVSVILDEDSRPCGQKSLYAQEHETSLMPVSMPTAWRIGKSPSSKVEEDVKYQVMERSKRIEEIARDLVKDYHYAITNKKNDSILRDVMLKRFEDEDEDDAASCSSSDLFELDHLSVVGKDRYHEELPVYETTRFDTNHVISNLIM